MTKYCGYSLVYYLYFWLSWFDIWGYEIVDSNCRNPNISKSVYRKTPEIQESLLLYKPNLGN